MALIVVADDEFLLAEMLADLLEDAGHEVLTASQGEAALRLVRERRPELVITDFMMPLMTGLELAEAIRDDPAVSAIPILLVSGAQGRSEEHTSDLQSIMRNSHAVFCMKKNKNSQIKTAN